MPSASPAPSRSATIWRKATYSRAWARTSRHCTANWERRSRPEDSLRCSTVSAHDTRWNVAVIRSVIRGVGAYLPKRVMTNNDLARIVDTSDEWIKERTGISERHIVADGELTSDLGIAASRQALVRSGIDPVDIDLVVCATSTPDRPFPATAVRIQSGLGVTKGAAFDVQAVCSGSVYALAVADNFLKAGQFKRAIVVGSETFSRILDWEDRGTCVLFGDGAGALVLEAQTQLGSREDRGILATRIRSDGRFEDLLYVDGGPGSTKTTGHLRMNGQIGRA